MCRTCRPLQVAACGPRSRLQLATPRGRLSRRPSFDRGYAAHTLPLGSTPSTTAVNVTRRRSAITRTIASGHRDRRGPGIAAPSFVTVYLVLISAIALGLGKSTQPAALSPASAYAGHRQTQPPHATTSWPQHMQCGDSGSAISDHEIISTDDRHVDEAVN